MELNISTKQAYSEIDEFLELLDEQTRNEIPEKLRQFFKEEKDENYHKGINPDISIKDQNLKRETLALIALLNLEYWCKDEKEKERLKKVYSDNEIKYQEELREKYNPDNLFKNDRKQNEVGVDNNIENVQLMNYKESVVKRVFDKILKFFHLKR